MPRCADADGCELDGREAIWKSSKRIQDTPGYENDSCWNVRRNWASGLAHARGNRGLRLAHVLNKKAYPDVIGVGGTYSFLKGLPCPIPYGTLVPQRVDNLLATGRSVAADNTMLNYTRLIAPCMLTGQAAGAAAALAVQENATPRAVNVAKLQELLRKQGAYLG